MARYSIELVVVRRMLGEMKVSIELRAVRRFGRRIVRRYVIELRVVRSLLGEYVKHKIELGVVRRLLEEI